MAMKYVILIDISNGIQYIVIASSFVGHSFLNFKHRFPILAYSVCILRYITFFHNKFHTRAHE